jgi:hypothetical protein
MPVFIKQNFIPLSADRKSLDELQRPRKHFTTTVAFFFLKRFFLVPKADTAPLTEVHIQ